MPEETPEILEKKLMHLGINHTYTHPVYLSALRTIPLQRPPTPKPVPSWKLIRPRPDDFPKLEEQTSDAYMEEKEPIRSVLTWSTFKGSTVFRQPTIDILNVSDPDVTQRQLSTLSNEYLNKAGDVMKSVENVAVKTTGAEKVTDSPSVTRNQKRGQKQPNKPRGSKTPAVSKKAEDAVETSKKNISPSEEELQSESQIELSVPTPQLKSFWLHIDELCELFETVDIYHNSKTYPVLKTYENLQFAGSSIERYPPSGLFLFVDSIHPSEAILGLSAISQWPIPRLRDADKLCQPRLSTSVNPEIRSPSDLDKTNESEASMNRFNTNSPTEQNPELHHSSGVAVPSFARMIVEQIIWNTSSGDPIKYLDVNANRAISLSFPPGRHCFRLTIYAPLGYHLTVLGNPCIASTTVTHPKVFSEEKQIEPRVAHSPRQEKSPRANKLTSAAKSQQRRNSPALSTEPMYADYKLELGDEDHLVTKCLKSIPIRVKYHADALIASLLNLGRIYDTVYDEDFLRSLLDRRLKNKQTSSEEEKLKQRVQKILQDYTGIRQELERLISTKTPINDDRHDQPLDSAVFRNALLTVFQKLCSSAERHGYSAIPEMNLAWRVLQCDWTTKNPFNVSYHLPTSLATATLTTTPRHKTKPQSARTEKRTRSILIQSSTEELEARWSKPIDPDILIAIIRIQAVFRGYHTRSCLHLRNPETIISFLNRVKVQGADDPNALSQTEIECPGYAKMKEHLMKKAKRVNIGWAKLLELLQRGHVEKEIGFELVQYLVEQNELKFGHDLDQFITHLDYFGTQPEGSSSNTMQITEAVKQLPDSEQRVGDWMTLLFRDILTTGPNPKVNKTAISKEFTMRFRTDLPNCEVRLINNDTNQQLSTIFTGIVHHVSLKPNKAGYSLLGICGPSPTPAGQWLLRFMAPGNRGLHGMPQIRNSYSRQLCKAFKVQELVDYYVPNEDGLLFRRHIQVNTDQLISMHLRLSAPSVPVRLLIVHANQVVATANGLGEARVWSHLLRSTKENTPTMDTSVDQLSSDKLSTSEEQAGSSSVSHKSGIKKAEKTSRQSSVSSSGRSQTGSVTSTSQSTRKPVRDSSCPLEDDKPHVHVCWIEAHVDRLKWPLSFNNWAFLANKKEAQLDSFLVKRQEQSPSRDRSPSTESTRSRQRVAVKSRNVKRTQPVPQIDEKQAHWKLRIILDAASGNEVKILPEENITERVRSMKAAWEELEPGRAERANLARENYLQSIASKLESCENKDVNTTQQDSASEIKDATPNEKADTGAVQQSEEESYTLDPPPFLSNTPSEHFQLEKELLAETLSHIEEHRLAEAMDLLRLLDESSFIGTHYLKALTAEENSTDSSNIVSLKQKIYNEFQSAWEEAKECLKSERTREHDRIVLLMKTLQLLSDKARAAYFESCEALRHKIEEESRNNSERTKEPDIVPETTDARAASRTASGKKRSQQRNSERKSRRRP